MAAFGCFILAFCAIGGIGYIALFGIPKDKPMKEVDYRKIYSELVAKEI